MPTLPGLVVVYHEFSVPPMEIAEAARGICTLIWVVNTQDPPMSPLVPLLRRLGTVIDTAGRDEDSIVDELRPLGPSGVITFAEQMVLAAHIASHLGLRFHTPHTARYLANKYDQRVALAAAGVPGPAFWAVPRHITDVEAKELADSVHYPAVLKPQDSLGSIDTYLVDGPQLLRSLIARLAADDYLVEELLVEAQPRSQQRFGDVLMVESVVTGGQFTHLTATGHFVPALPFRGSGSFVPSHLPDDLVGSVFAATEAAATALGIDEGVINTDIVLTPDGPRVLEVNGRVGGQVPALFELLGAAAVLPLAMRLALRAPGADPEPLSCDRVAYCMTVQPPVTATRLLSLAGLDEVAKIPGVARVVPSRRAGDTLDWRRGTINQLFIVYGTTTDHAELAGVRQLVDAVITAEYEHAHDLADLGLPDYWQGLV